MPLKITSSIELDLRLFEDDSPITHLIASKILDFPHPLGPMIPVTPSSINNSVGCANDLNPDIFNLFTVNNFN